MEEIFTKTKKLIKNSYIMKIISERVDAMTTYYIGIDIGTTSTKSLMFDRDGSVLAKSSMEYGIYSPNPFFKEQNPQDILNAVIFTLKECILKSGVVAKDIAFVSFSSVMHSLIAVDKDGNPLTNCIIWADSRSTGYVQEFKKNGMGQSIYSTTGTPCHPMSPLYKIMWLRDNEPEIFNKAYKFISIKEYIFYKFFGQYIVDYSVASSSGMFNIFDLNWDKEALKILGISEERLSKPYPTTYIVKNLKDEYSNETGIEKDTAFVLGASDGCLANLGSKAIRKGAAAATIGTSGAIRVAFDKPVTDSRGRVFCYVLTENKYIVGGPMNNGGIVYRWFRDNFGQMEAKVAENLGFDSYELINEYIKNVKPGSEGLVFLPFLTGERAPYWNSNLRGGFLGISDIHKKQHFARAIIEGICYGMNDIYEAVLELVKSVDTIYVNGGFTRSMEWVQVLSDVLGTKVVVPQNYESSCLGALILGMYATGMIKNLEDASYIIKESSIIEPRGDVKEVYGKYFKVYREAVQRIAPVLETLTDIQKSSSVK